MMAVSKASNSVIIVSSAGGGLKLRSLRLAQGKQGWTDVAPVRVAGASRDQHLDRGDLSEARYARAGLDHTGLRRFNLRCTSKVAEVTINERQIGGDQVGRRG